VQKGYKGRKLKFSLSKGKSPIRVLVSGEKTPKPKRPRGNVITIEDEVDLAKERRLVVYTSTRQSTTK